MHIVMAANASWCVRMKKLTAFLELEAAILDREIRCLAAAHEQEVVKNCEHECPSHVRTETTVPRGILLKKSGIVPDRRRLGA
jgi:hypothetical protein